MGVLPVLQNCCDYLFFKKGSKIMSDSKKTAKAEKKAAKAEKKALKAAKKVAKAEKQAAKAAKKMAKSQKKAGVTPAAVPETKKAATFGHPVRNLLVAMLIALVLGVLFIVEPELVYTYCTYAVGGLLALFGLVYIILYFVRRPVSGEYHSEFGFGLIAVLAGAYVALSSMLFTDTTMHITFTVLVQLIGILVALDGIMKLQYMLDLGRMGYKKWWILLITAVLGIALGVGMTVFLDYITYYSLAYGFNVMFTLGLIYCLNALLDLISLIVVAVRNRKAAKAAALAEAEAKVAVAAAAAAEEEPQPVEEVVILVEEPAVEEPVLIQEPLFEADPAPAAEPAMAATAEE